MATFKYRNPILLERQPDLQDIGRTLPRAAAATFPANTIVTVNGSGEATNVANNTNTNLAYAFEPAVDDFYQAEGPGNVHTKPTIAVGYLRGNRIGITVIGTFNTSMIGAKRPILLSGSNVGLNPTASGTPSENIATILRVFDDPTQAGATTGDVNVFVEAILDDSACYTL